MSDTVLTNILVINDTIRVSDLIDKTIENTIHTLDTNTGWDLRLILSILIPILITLLGGRFALKQVKQNVYMNSRVKWVDDFRDLISKYIASVMRNSSNLSTYKMFEDKFLEIDKRIVEGMGSEECKEALRDNREKMLEWHKEYSESNNEFNIYSSKVLLYLDADKEKHQEIIKLIDKVDNLFESKKSNITCKMFCDDLKVIRQKSNMLIKKELSVVLPKKVVGVK